MKRILILAILSIFLIGTASAGYVPKEYKNEAKTIRNDVQLYQFAVKYQDQFWAQDILRQLAQNYTNNGKLEQLYIEMKKYIK